MKYINHINEEGYSKLYLILENIGLNDHEIFTKDIPKIYRDNGLMGVTCRINYSEKPNFEFMSFHILNKKFNIIREIYISLYEPKYIINMSDIELTQEEKELLYSYTSKYWNQLMNCYKKMYDDKYNQECIREFSNKDFSKIIYPDCSPDYRLLPDISPKDIVL